MTRIERENEKARLLALADRADTRFVGQRICAAGIRENLTHGTLKRAQEAGKALEKMLADPPSRFLYGVGVGRGRLILSRSDRKTDEIRKYFSVPLSPAAFRILRHASRILNETATA